MIPVVFTHYGLGEQNFTTELPQVPQVGDSVHLDEPEIAIARVFHVRWCYTKSTSKWHVEIGIR